MRDRRVTRHPGQRPAPTFVRRHHPGYNKLRMQGWKAVDAAGKLPGVYHDGGGGVRRLDLADARRPTDDSGVSHFAVATSG